MNESVTSLFWLSSTESIIAFIFILVSSIVTIFCIKKFSLNKATLMAFVLGIIGGVIFLVIWESQGSLSDPYLVISNVDSMPLLDSNGDVIFSSQATYDPVNNQWYVMGLNSVDGSTEEIVFVSQPNLWYSEVSNWFNFLPQIFLNLLQLIVIPLVFITIVWLITVKSKESNMSRSSFIKSVAFLALMEAIAILVAMALTPLLNTVSFDQSIFGATAFDPVTGEPIEAFDSFWSIIIGWFPDNWSALLSGTAVTISVVFVAWLIAFSINKFADKGNEAAIELTKFIELFYEMFKTLIKWILFLVPFTIFSKLPTLMYGNAAGSWVDLGVLMGIAFLGMFILISMHILIMFFSQKRGYVKSFLKNIIPSWTTSLLTRSSIAALPQHSDALVKSGINDDVANTVPTLGTSMGLSTCAGMYPAMISIVTLNLTATDTTNIAVSYILIFIVIFFTSFGVAGVPGAFDATAVSALSAANLSPALVPVVLVVEPILDPFRTIVNTTGSSATAAIMDRINSKKRKKKKKKEEDQIQYEHAKPSTADDEEYELKHIIKDEKKKSELLESKKKKFLKIDTIKINKKIKSSKTVKKDNKKEK